MPELTIYGAPAHAIDHAALHWWNRYIPLLPSDFFQIFSRNFTEHISVDMELERGLVKIVGENKDDKFEGHREFLFDEVERYRDPQSQFEVSIPCRGQGIGKSWFRMSVELSAALGKNEHTFYAGSDCGGDSWARMGIPLNMRDEAAKSRKDSSRQYMYRVNAIRDHLDAAVYKEAHALCQMKEDESIIRLSAMGIEVPDDVRENIDQRCRSKMFRSLKDAYSRQKSFGKDADIRASSELSNMGMSFKLAAERGRNPTLSEFLSCNSGWPAIVDFENAQRMKNIGARAGGWRTIEPL